MKSHRTDSVSLFFGLAFLMISLGYVAKVYLDLNLPSMGWFIAAGLVFLGIVGAITALIPSRPEVVPAGEQGAGTQETEEADEAEEAEKAEEAEEAEKFEDQREDADAEQAR